MYTAKPLAFPCAKKLSELFSDISAEKAVGLTYCVVRSPGRVSAWVRPLPCVTAFIGGSMRPILDGHMHFQFVERDDDTCLVTIDWDHIIGSRWLALVPAAELNKYLPKEE